MPSQSINLLKNVSGVGEATIANFRDAGYETLDDLEGIGAEALKEIPGVGQATAAAILDFLENVPDDPIKAYRHAQKRKNIPPAGLAGQGKVEDRPSTRYFYDPHLPPVLRFDDSGEADQLPDLLQKARRKPLSQEEADLLAEALRTHQPWLEWSGKREKRWFDVDPVALHIHERVSAEAIIAAAKRKPLQPSLFADPDMEWREAVQFYEHDTEWSNRLILGDSLEVMHSLANREDLAGKVQMIYVDPPYGISFRSNFQPFIESREVRDRDADLTREPEQVKAYRDTWTLGVHSYLAYLKDRLLVARELLTDTGSIFVQISDENLHRVRAVMDEVFGPDNFVSLITFATTSGFQTNELSRGGDYLVWYAKNSKAGIQYQVLFEQARKEPGEGGYRYIMLPTGETRGLTVKEIRGEERFPKDAKLYKPDNILSQGAASSEQRFVHQGKQYRPNPNSHWKASFPEGMNRLASAGRIHVASNSIQYIRYADDFPVKARNNIWVDTLTGQFTEEKKYVVQTNTKVIERCILMTTKPGDIVLDPTCGSGTSPYAAEKWGRRWVAIDTSRVALALSRQRLLTAQFDYYELADQESGPTGGIVYETVPHIMLGDIANNQALDSIFEQWEPVLDDKLETLNLTLWEHVTPELRTRLKTKLVAKERDEGKRAITEADERRWLLPEEKWEHWQVPFDADSDWPEPLRKALNEYREAWRQKMDEVNETIAASAPKETLVDQPQVVKGVVRVSGPFTVEGVQPVEEYLDAETPIGGAPEEMEAFEEQAGFEEPVNAEAYLDKMIRLLRKDGVRFPDNKEVEFERLEPLSGDVLHAEGEWQTNGQQQRVVVSFGPQYGPITAQQVEHALRTAYRRGYDDIVFAGFSFDGIAQATIDEDQAQPGSIRAHKAHIRPDVNMDDLLKDTSGSQLFTVSGEPRVELEEREDGEYVVRMEGVDVYDPVTNQIHATRAGKVAAWFLDHDYNGRTFNISQAFFPDENAWDKLAKALKTVVDPQRFAAFSSTESLPFPPGEHKRAAVKVIDPRGNEVMKIIRLDGDVSY